MVGIDLITGLPIGEDGKFPVVGKKMCRNCEFCENGEHCLNEINLKNARDKVLASVPSGYEITNLDLKPLPLKDSTKKCGQWSLNKAIADEWIKHIFE